MKSNIGKIIVPMDCIHDGSYKNIAVSFGHINLFPVSVVALHEAGASIITGLSDFFTPIEQGEIVPYYEIQVEDMPDGTQTIKVVRAEE